jgi:glycosyltransferase involved in cell wall biosynthesis
LRRRRPRLLFVFEQALGHRVHGRNLEQSLQRHVGEIDATILPVAPVANGLGRLPLLNTWSVQASWAARCELEHRRDDGPIDGIFLHSQATALFASRLMRSVPTVISLDATPRNFDALGSGYGHRRQGALLESGKDFLNRRALQAASAVVCLSGWAAASVVHDYGVPPSRVHVIRAGVNLDRFRPRVDGRDEGPTRLLFVGNDFRRKGGFDLLAAVARVRGPVEVDVVCAASEGLPPLPAAWRLHAGVVPLSAELIALYRRADVFVLPSRSECYGHAIAEALACGLPVVACPTGGVPEMVRDGVTGWLVPPESPAELATALQTLIDQPELCAAMGRCSRRLAEDEHDLDRNVDQVLELMVRGR